MINLKITQSRPGALTLQDVSPYGEDNYPLASELRYWTITVWKGDRPYRTERPNLLKPETITSRELGMGSVFPSGGIEIGVQVYGQSSFKRVRGNYFALFPLEPGERVWIRRNGVYEDVTPAGTPKEDGDWEWRVLDTMDVYDRIEIREGTFVKRNEDVIVDELEVTYPQASLTPVVLMGGSARLILTASERGKWAEMVGALLKTTLEKGKPQAGTAYGTVFPVVDTEGQLAFIGQRLTWLESWHEGDIRLAEDTLKLTQTDLAHVRTKLLG